MSRLQNLLADLSDLKLSVDYWDVRIEDSVETNLQMVDGELVACASSPALGAFVRLRKNGFWFYESTTEIPQLKSILLKLSRQEKGARHGDDAFKAEKHSPFSAMIDEDIRFTSISLDKKLQLVKKYDAVLSENKKMASRTVRYKDIFKRKSFLNSTGTRFEFDFNQGGIANRMTLKDGSLLFDDVMHMYGADFSRLEGREQDLRAHILEASRFLHAPAIKPGKYKVVLDPEVAGVFTHESFGHKSEADFMLGNAESIEEWKIGKNIGAECLSIVDSGLNPGTSGYCPVDDEGTPAQKNYLIKNGILTGRLHSRETAQKLDEKPTGNSRAMNFEFEPIVRMTSTYIEPGRESIDTILQRYEGAILVKGVKHGSGLSTFTIAPYRGYMIGKNGAQEPVRLTVISGSVFATLKNIEAVSSEFKLHSFSIGGCGKMEQWPLPVADGGPYVVVSEMQVN